MRRITRKIRMSRKRKKKSTKTRRRKTDKDGKKRYNLGSVNRTS